MKKLPTTQQPGHGREADVLTLIYYPSTENHHMYLVHASSADPSLFMFFSCEGGSPGRRRTAVCSQPGLFFCFLVDIISKEESTRCCVQRAIYAVCPAGEKSRSREAIVETLTLLHRLRLQ